ncbi:MAG: hypothetical protein WC236_05330 [Gallionellaceae bacterium]|jgi:hypothetical protein
MIYILEIPEQGRAHAWFAFDKQDLLRKIYAADTRKEWKIFDVITARELLELSGMTPDNADVRDKFPAICSLGEQLGWDTPLYRADYLLGDGVFQTDAVTETDACVAALTQRSKNCRIYWSDTQATAALENDPIFQSKEGYRARAALHEQLVSLEILEGD